MTLRRQGYIHDQNYGSLSKSKTRLLYTFTSTKVVPLLFQCPTYANPLSGVTEKKNAIIYGLGYFSTTVTEYHDLSNLQRKAFNWGPRIQRVTEFVTIMAGSIGRRKAARKAVAESLYLTHRHEEES